MEDFAAATSELLSQLSKLVKGIGADDVEAILAKEVKIVLVPKGATVVMPLVLSDVAQEVRQQVGLDDIVALLDREKRLTPAKLRQLAHELNLTVPPTTKTRPAIILYIAQTMADHRRRTRGVA